MNLADITASIFIAFSFSVVGLLINTMIRHTAAYAKLSNLNFIVSDTLNRYLGVLLFKKILLNTFWKHFNPTLKIGRNISSAELLRLRNEMTYAEISHLIAFVFVIILAVICKVYDYRSGLFLPLLIANIIFHFYPPLLQQYNKRRLDRLINKYQK